MTHQKTRFSRPRLAIRIENSDNGAGIYQNGVDIEKRSIRSIDFASWKAHQNMNSINQYFHYAYDYSCYFCAYLSIGDITKYLTRKSIVRLIGEGYIIFQLNIRAGFYTADQVFYKKKHVIGQINITHLFH